MEIYVDYSDIGYAKTFSVFQPRYKRKVLLPGTEVTIMGDGVEDQIGIIQYWSPDNQVHITLKDSDG